MPRGEDMDETTEDGGHSQSCLRRVLTQSVGPSVHYISMLKWLIPKSHRIMGMIVNGLKSPGNRLVRVDRFRPFPPRAQCPRSLAGLSFTLPCPMDWMSLLAVATYPISRIFVFSRVKDFGGMH